MGSGPMTDVPPPPPGFTLEATPPPTPPAGFTLIDPNPQPASRMDRLAMGGGDMIHGGAQLMVNALPNGVVGAVNDATAWVNRQPVIGPVTRAIGMTPATPAEVNQGVAQREADYQASRAAGGAEPGSTDWWRVGGNIAGALPLAAVAPVGATIPRAMLSGAAQGAISGAATPVTDTTSRPYWDQVQQNATTGAGVGAVGGAIGNIVGRGIGGNRNVNPAVQELHDAGVRMTPGQIAGGYAQRVEDIAGSIPFVGQQVRNAQRGSMESFNRSVANAVLRPLGQSVDDATPAGREMVAEVGRRVSAAYDDAISRVSQFGPDARFAADLQRVSGQFLTPESRQTFTRLVRDRIASRFEGGPIDGATYKTIDSELGQIARNFGGSTTAAEREIGTAVRELQRSIRDLAARTNPQAAPAIRAADAAYSRLLRLEGAAGSQAATEGVFTPAQFSRAVQQFDNSPRDRAFARGDALMQELSDAGRAVLPRTVPDSGTPERAMLANLLLGGGVGVGLGTGGAGVIPALAAAGTVAGAYTGPVRGTLQSIMLAQRGPALRAAGQAVSRAAPPAAVPLGGLWLEPPQ